MPQVPDDEVMHQPVAFIGIGSKNEQEMQQLIIEDKVSKLPKMSEDKVVKKMLFSHTDRRR